MTATKSLAIVAATVVTLGGLTSTPAWSLSRDFRLHNHTSYTITGFAFSYRGSDTWTAMRGNQIGPGEDSDVTFDQSGPCDLQFRVQIRVGSTQRYADFTRPFDFCTLRSVAIYYDRGSDVFTAHSSTSRQQ